MKKRLMTMAVVSALMLSATSCAKEPEVTTTTAPVFVAEEKLETTTTTAVVTEEITTTEEEKPAELSAPTGEAGDNIYNSTVPTNLSDEAQFSLTVQYTADPLNYQYEDNIKDLTSEHITIEKNMTLKMLSDKLATFGGLVEAEGTLAYSTDEEYKFAYIGFGYNLGISEDKFVDLYIEFVDKDGNIIEDRALIDDNSIVKAIAVYEEDIDDIVNQGGAAYDNTYVAPIISTPLRVKFNINSDKLYETFLGRDSFYFHSNKIGTLLHINNEKSYVAKNSNYTLITCPDTTYDTWVNGVVLVIN